jgi:hypothetical protein
MKGRLVWAAPAAADSGWWRIGFERRLLGSLLVAGFGTFLVLYGLSGICFGYLPLFVGTWFVPAQGVPALLVSIGALSMGVAMATHLVQRHWSTASKPGCEFVRREAWMFAGLLVGLGFAAWALVIAGDVHALDRPMGVQPHADWVLAPLPWLWRLTLPLARESVQDLLFLGGLCCAGAGLLLSLLGLMRVSLICFCVLAGIIGAYLLGDSSYGYGASRGLTGIAEPAMRAEWAANPGLFNSGLWFTWWSGSILLAVGAIGIPAVARMTPAQASEIRQRMRT